MQKFLDKSFYSLKNRNFRLYFTAHFISVAGSWMESVALGWLAYEMTGSGTQLGLILGLSTLPLLLFGLVGGYVGQRYENYKILTYTQNLFGVVPLLVAFLIFIDKLNIEVLYFSALWVGLMRIVDEPVRQGFMKTVVGKENLQNAGSLFSSVTAFARISGPLLGGVIIQFFGAGICFLLNAISFFYMSYIIRKMDKAKFFHTSDIVKEKKILESLKYVYNNEIVFVMLMIGVVMGTFMYEFQTLFLIYAKTIFQGSVLSYSLILSVFSAGAITAGIYSASNKDVSMVKLRKSGIALSVVYFSQAVVPNIWIFLISVFCVGFLLIQFSITAGTLLKSVCDDKHLNIVMALWSMACIGMLSIGSIMAGVLSDHHGVRFVTIFYSTAFLVFVLFLTRHRLNKTMKRKVIFVHGLGVRKDARGMFTDIEKSFLNDENVKDIECIFTDLNIIDEESGNLTLNPLDVQAQILQKVYDREKENSEIYIIAHSQGCAVTTLANFENLKKIFLLAPPTNNDLTRSIERMKKREGTVIDLDGESIMMRRDGSRTIIPKEYWENRKELVYWDCYKNFSEKHGKEKIKIIIAKQDEIVGNDSVLGLEKMGQVFEIDSKHNFDQNRQELADIIKENL